MLWMSGASLKWLFILAAGVIALVPIAWTYILHDYQKQRLLSFLDASPDIKGSGYQLYQAQIAVGSGGWMGKGLTNGTQAQGEFLPVQTTDFVLAVLAEELGFIGVMVVFTLFFLLLWRILVAGWRSRTRSGRCSRPAWPRWSCSSSSSTSGWSWASCRSPASRSPS